jgi:hypothetical protein
MAAVRDVGVHLTPLGARNPVGCHRGRSNYADDVLQAGLLEDVVGV